MSKTFELTIQDNKYPSVDECMISTRGAILVGEGERLQTLKIKSGGPVEVALSFDEYGKVVYVPVSQEFAEFINALISKWVALKNLSVGKKRGVTKKIIDESNPLVKLKYSGDKIEQGDMLKAFCLEPKCYFMKNQSAVDGMAGVYFRVKGGIKTVD
jgi:hypothetical protein